MPPLQAPQHVIASVIVGSGPINKYYYTVVIRAITPTPSTFVVTALTSTRNISYCTIFLALE